MRALCPVLFVCLGFLFSPCCRVGALSASVQHSWRRCDRPFTANIHGNTSLVISPNEQCSSVRRGRTVWTRDRLYQTTDRRDFYTGPMVSQISIPEHRQAPFRTSQLHGAEPREFRPSSVGEPSILEKFCKIREARKVTEVGKVPHEIIG